MKRTVENQNSVASAFDDWCLSNVATLIDSVADGRPPGKKTWKQIEEAARLDLRMMPRLVKLARSIFDKYRRGELTREEARQLNGTTGEEYNDE